VSLVARSQRRICWQCADVRACSLVVFLKLDIDVDCALLTGNTGRRVGIILSIERINLKMYDRKHGETYKIFRLPTQCPNNEDAMRAQVKTGMGVHGCIISSACENEVLENAHPHGTRP
jgi:hypothetical protein